MMRGMVILNLLKISYINSKIISLSRPKPKQLLTIGVLAGLFLIFALIFFPWANDYCFNDNTGLHIIDVHVQKCGVNGLFDGPYVEEAALKYRDGKYEKSFLIVDTIFPIVYSLLFISLISVRETKYHVLFVALIVAGALFDYGENFSFLYYLHHPSPRQAGIVAFFTSIKSILFPANIILALFLFVRGLIKKH